MSKDILIIAEQRNSQVQNVTFELIGVSKELAKANDSKVNVLLLGHNVGAEVEKIVENYEKYVRLLI